ncbi:MAG TPA: hypothetical protein VLW55_04505 [Burkholderiaceae bacterium]|nr:hypothetical protein [Burkholderiaceae bacterium]
MKHLRRRVLAAIVALGSVHAFAQEAGTQGARPPRWLTITVRQDRPSQVADGVRAPHGAVVTDSRSAAVYQSGKDSHSARAQSSEQTMRVREGARALVQFEAAVPMTFSHYALSKGSVEELRGEMGYNALVEFAVSARLAGTAVTLLIEPHDGSIRTESSERARLWASARGRLGEWIPVGGADLRENASVTESNSGAVRAQTRPSTDQRGVWLKVDLADEGAR